LITCSVETVFQNKLFAELALEEYMDRSQDRLCKEWMTLNQVGSQC